MYNIIIPILKKEKFVYITFVKKNLLEERFKPRHLLRDQMVEWSGAIDPLGRVDLGSKAPDHALGHLDI